MSLTIDELFTPAPPPAWLEFLLKNAATLGLVTSSWQAGAPERTILAMLAVALNFEDATTSLIAQGGFLDFAAAGTVQYTNADGTTITKPVTPEGGRGWLDALASSVYGVTRIQSTTAGGVEAITNTSVSSYGPFVATTYHVADPNNKATYSNTGSLTIAPSAVFGGTITSVVSASGLIKVVTSGAHGLSNGDAVGIVGVIGVTPLVTPTAWYVDVVDTTRFTLRGSNFAGSYTSGGKVYAPTIATFVADVPGSASTSVDADGVANVHTIVQAVTSLVGVSVDNLTAFRGSDVETNLALAARCRLNLQSWSPAGPRGAYAFAALSAIELAPTLAPPAILSQAVTRCEVFRDNLTGHVTAWVAGASGPPSAADVIVIGNVLDAYVVPLAVTATTKAAAAKHVAAVADVWVPAALATAATVALFQSALEFYFSVLPIGGVTDPGGAYTHVVPFDAVLGALFAAGVGGGVTVQQATLTLDGSTGNVVLAFSATTAEVAVLDPAAPTVTLHPV